ncbi:MAG: hypothetical protein JWQ27_3092 [Ferruginibacter sp.]|nr:hypothetical protein [Ferruginibacter sp.]
MQLYIYAALAFLLGFIVAWVIRSMSVAKMRKMLKSSDGFLESEKLMKETLQKENIQLHQQKQAAALEFNRQLKIMDTDILLLQKSNEETEELLLAGQPEVHALKLKLIEANNTIARLKAQLGIK